jgi:hypothetical protein
MKGILAHQFLQISISVDCLVDLKPTGARLMRLQHISLIEAVTAVA